MKFKNVALIGKYQSLDVTDQVIELAHYLNNNNFSVYIDCGEYCNMNPNFTKFSTGNITGNITDWLNILDLVVVVGGDGTLLSAARKIVNHNIPIIGINQGTLGFMTDISSDEMLKSIDDILLHNNYKLENRSLINAKVIRDNKIISENVALNDIVISRGSIGNMIEFDITIDGDFVLSQKSDGVIFSTPTGSTAYSLAAGGPIMHPHSNVISMVPICPQSLSNRPLVVSDHVVIEFLLTRENATQIHFDGQECFDLRFHDKVVLSKHNSEFKIVHPTSYNYYNTLRRKLDWSKRVS